VLFEANSFFDLLDRLNMIEEIAAADKRRLEQLNEAAIAVNEAKDTLATERVALQAAKTAMEVLQLSLEAKRQEASELLNSLIAKGEEYDAIIENSEEMQEKLMQELAAKEDAYDKAKYSEWLATSVPPTTHPGGPGNTVDGITWYLPTTNYYISSPFGYRWHPISGKWKMHNGIDMAAPTGTAIYATRAGVVTVASYEEGGAGYYVKLNHGDGYISIYMHMTHYIVKPGDFVQAGQKIGYVGSTGGSTGPHLHFGIAKNGTYVTPSKYIDA
jgi:murein DD-endopeptidase MepM/ murein hydrolase activator NlpD